MYGEVYVGERTMHGRLQDRRRESEVRQLVRQARAHPTGRPSSVGRWLLSQMSYRLMAVGARLVSLGLPPYLPAQQELKRNGSSRAPA
jgi:hypothetical protein